MKGEKKKKTRGKNMVKKKMAQWEKRKEEKN